MSHRFQLMCLTIVTACVVPCPLSAGERPTINCWCDGERGENINRIFETLGQPISAEGWNFRDTPIEALVDGIREQYNISINIDQAALDDAGMTLDEPVTIQVRNMSLRSAMRLLLQTKQLTYTIRNESLTITTPEEAEYRSYPCVYNVSSFIKSKNSRKELVEAICSCVAPESWDTAGGSGDLKTINDNLIVIRQTTAVHEQIRELLESIALADGAAHEPNALEAIDAN